MSLTELTLHEAPLAFLDVETTGLNPNFGDRVIEIAVLSTVGLDKIDTLNTLINPNQPLNPSAMAVNGITPEMVANAPTFEQIIPQIRAFLANRVVVAHNAPFDLGFLEVEGRLVRRSLPIGPVLDTLQLARRQYSFRRNSLDSIARILHIPTPNAHRALGDVLTTYAVFRHFSSDLVRQQNPLVEDWIRMQGGSAWESTPSTTALAADDPIAIALHESRPIAISYRSRDGQVTRRVVEPVSYNGKVLIAFCHLRRSQRTFRLDRILEASLMIDND